MLTEALVDACLRMGSFGNRAAKQGRFVVGWASCEDDGEESLCGRLARAANDEFSCPAYS